MSNINIRSSYLSSIFKDDEIEEVLGQLVLNGNNPLYPFKGWATAHISARLKHSDAIPHTTLKKIADSVGGVISAGRYYSKVNLPDSTPVSLSYGVFIGADEDFPAGFSTIPDDVVGVGVEEVLRSYVKGGSFAGSNETPKYVLTCIPVHASHVRQNLSELIEVTALSIPSARRQLRCLSALGRSQRGISKVKVFDVTVRNAFSAPNIPRYHVNGFLIFEDIQGILVYQGCSESLSQYHEFAAVSYAVQHFTADDPWNIIDINTFDNPHLKPLANVGIPVYHLVVAASTASDSFLSLPDVPKGTEEISIPDLLSNLNFNDIECEMAVEHFNYHLNGAIADTKAGLKARCIKVEGELVAFALYVEHPEGTYIAYLSTVISKRRKGYATRLLKTFCDPFLYCPHNAEEASTAFERLFNTTEELPFMYNGIHARKYSKLKV
jgi:hypothetical protein